MGCCCRRSRELQELEAERERLINKTRLLESKISSQGNQETESNVSALRPEQFKFIDHDQYSSLKIIEALFSLVSGDLNVYQSLTQSLQNLSSSKDDEKLAKYADLRIKETDLQKKLISTCQDCLKDLAEITNSKYAEIESRIEKVENLLSSSFSYSEERHSIKKKLETITKNSKQDFPTTVSTLKTLESIEKDLFLIESKLPKLIKDDFFLLKLSQVERNISGLVKASLSSTSSIDSVFGSVEVPNTIDVQALRSFELDTLTFDTLFESLGKTISSLNELELAKAKSIENHEVHSKLKEIDQLLTRHFISSEKNKDDACSKLNRVSRGNSGLNFLTAASLFKFDEEKRTIPESVLVLKSKAEKYLKSLESQDKLLLEMIEKFGKVDFVIDEIELKIHEFFTYEVKDLQKSVGILEASFKSLLDETNEKLISYQNETQKDVLERLQFLLEKLTVSENLLKVKNSLKDSNNKEISRMKNEMQEKINELQTHVNSLENEKELMTNSLITTKSQLTVTSDMAESLLKTSNEKELQVTELKNKIASLHEEIEQINEDKSKLQDEVDDLQKELKDCKRTIRNKEHELDELRESLSKDE